MENLLGNMPFKHVVEILGRRAVHRAEMLRIHQVVDQLAGVGVDDHLVQMPAVQPLITVHFRQVRNHHISSGRLAFRVVPDKQQAVDFTGQPGAGFRFGRNTLAVRDLDTFTAGFVLPMVKRTDHTVVLDSALGQVGTHVRAMGVEHTDLARRSGECQQSGTKNIQGMQLAVTVFIRLAQAMPSPAKARS